MAPEDPLDLLEIGGGRDDHAARAHHRLGEEGGDGLGSLRQDQALQRIGAARGERLLALPVAPLPPVMRAVGVEEARERQVEPRVVRRHAGYARRRRGDAVIAALATDDLLLGRAADGVVVEPDQLDRGVDRLGARVGEEGPRHRHRRQRLQAFGELDLGFVAPAVEPVIEGERAHLAVRRLGEALVAEAERDAPEPRHPLDIFLAGLVPDIDAVAARHDQRAFLLVLQRVGIGVEQRLRVAEPVKVRSGYGIHAIEPAQPPVTLIWRETAGSRRRRSMTKSWPLGLRPMASSMASIRSASSSLSRSGARRSAASSCPRHI